MKSFLYLGLIALLTVTACAQQQNWFSMESKEGRFSVSMPGHPKEIPQIINTPVGEIDTHPLVLRRQNTAFIVMYSDYPKEYFKDQDMKSILDSFRDGAVKNTQGTLLLEKILTLGPYPGREIIIATPNGEGTSTDRFFLVGNRLYQLIVACPKADRYSPDINQFLESFKLLPAESK